MKFTAEARFLTTAQAAKQLGISARRVRALIKEGRILATAYGAAQRPGTSQPMMWLIAEADLEEFARKPRFPGEAGVKALRGAA